MHYWVLILTTFYISRSCFSENGTFIGTRDWQEIREGQSVPTGLHVRINMQTGKKEAKLLDESEGQKGSALSEMPQKFKERLPEDSATNVQISKKLEDALKNLPKEQMVLEYSPEKLDKIKREHKSYKELKKSYDELKHNFKSDAEIITLLLQEYENISKTEPHKDKRKTADLLRILDNLKYLSHQIDNAIWFIDEGGLDVALLPMIVNQTNVDLRVQAMRVLGAVTQNNPKAQIKVFEKNIGSYLAQILITSTHTDELSTALYAFGSLLRKFPLAQQRILSKLGTQALVAVIAKECELKIKAKAVTLINDLIVERELVLSKAASDEGDPVAAAQYADLNLPEWLISNGYCDLLDVVVASKLYEFLEQPDLAEYFIHALTNTQYFCKARWSQSPQLRHTLLTLINRFVRRADEYNIEVAQSTEELVKTLYKENLNKDEL